MPSKVILTSQSVARKYFLFEINSEIIGISKLVSQLKLLPNLFELIDNDTIDMSTIIKKFQLSQNRRFLIGELEKLVRLIYKFVQRLDGFIF